jgi:hypothetical protein
VPNETVVESQVTNLTHFLIRRLDLTIDVPYKPDLKQVRELLQWSRATISTWTTSANYLALKNQMHEDITRSFERAAIDLRTAPRVP